MAVLYLGLLAERAGVILRGTYAGPSERCVAFRTETLELAQKATTTREIVDGLSRIARQEGFTIETGAPARGELTFYLWHPEAA
jgi:hypothetical protein